MPIGFSPDEWFPVTAEATGDVAWKVRALSVADIRKVKALCKEAYSTKEFEAENAKLNEAILIGVVGWDRPCALNAEALDTHLTSAQKYRLIDQYPALVFMGELEKKASRSPLQSGAVSTAKAASAGAATTNRAKKARQPSSAKGKSI